MPFAALNPVLTEQDIYLFREGTHFRAYEKLGAHPVQGAAAGIGEKGVRALTSRSGRRMPNV